VLSRLKEAIETVHQASFSSTGLEDVTDAAKATLAKLREQAREESRPVSEEEKRQAAARLVRAYGHSEITLEKCLREGISERIFNALLKQETTNYINLVTQHHRRLVSEMSEQDRQDLTQKPTLIRS
jgi:flagellar biosynthesis GTPase FlhF